MSAPRPPPERPILSCCEEVTASESWGCNLGRSAPGLCKIGGLLRLQLVKRHRTPPVLPILPVLFCSRMLRLIIRAVPAKCLDIWSRRQPAGGQQTYTKLRAACVVSLKYYQPRESCQISPQPANGAAEKQYSAAWDNHLLLQQLQQLLRLLSRKANVWRIRRVQTAVQG